MATAVTGEAWRARVMAVIITSRSALQISKFTINLESTNEIKRLFIEYY